MRLGPSGAMEHGEVLRVRNYVPKDDGLEPTDFDEYIDFPAESDHGLAARVYIKVERDPERAAEIGEQQNAAIMELLQWTNGNQA